MVERDEVCRSVGEFQVARAAEQCVGIFGFVNLDYKGDGYVEFRRVPTHHEERLSSLKTL